VAEKVTAEDFRRMVLSLPETSEGAHMGHPDFRVRGKIFATLWPDTVWGVVKLSPEEQEAFVRADPAAFEPVPGGWGRQGNTRVLLEAADEESLRRAVLAAWRRTAPKRIVAQFDGESS
jgi:hypothetical protein